MFRICQARNGYYFVQRFNGSDYKMVGDFYRTVQGARNFIRGAKYGARFPDQPSVRVVEYV